MINDKIEKDLQDSLDEATDDQLLTVVVKTTDVTKLCEHLDEVKRHDGSLSYHVAPAFAVVRVSASKKTIKKVLHWQEVVIALANKEFTLPTILP